MIGGAEGDGGEYSDNGNMCAQPALSGCCDVKEPEKKFIVKNKT